MDVDLHGRSVLVTGAGRGIGRATALALAAAGARTIVTARSRDEIEAVATEIKRAGGAGSAIVADVAQVDEVRHLVDAAGPIDILVNNAGIVGPIGRLAAAEPVEWVHNIAINLEGVFLACRFALPGMLERGWGRIVNVSSGAARGTTEGWSAYSAAKAGVEALTRVLAREVDGHNVHVNAVRPGIVDTEMQVEIRASPVEAFGEENVERFRGYKERGLLRNPAHPARLILWLLGPEADAVNGEVLAIDDPDIAQRIGLEPMGR